MRIHYWMLVGLIKFWPKLFERFFTEYDEVWIKYGKMEHFDSESGN